MITVGITTYNRTKYLTKAAESLAASVNIDQCNVRVYDDKSTNLTTSEISTILPFAKEIIVREKNLGADENIRQMYENFLDTSDKIFFNADSDLLFHPEWIPFLMEHIEHTDGVLSLYNSNYHPGVTKVTIGKNRFNVCEHLGSAGTAFTRPVVEKIIRDMSYSNSRCFDWKWSEYLPSKNIRLMSSEISYIQHIGITGQNCNGLDQLNYGLNFFPGNDVNTKYLIEFYEEVLAGGLKTSMEAMDEVRKTKDYKLGNLILKVPRKIKNYLTN